MASEEPDLEAALAAIAKISDAVKEFKDPELRAKAFELLTHTAFGSAAKDTNVDNAPSDKANDTELGEADGVGSGDPVGTEDPKAKAKPAKKVRKASKKANFDIPKDIDWAPEGKESLHSFAGKKSPTTNPERALVATYYLIQILGLTVTTGNVLAAFRAMEWKDPSSPDNNLQQAGSKHWLDTANMSDIKLVWGGQRYVENELPKPAAGK